MAVAFDAASSQGNGFVASSTHSHTCSGSDRLLVVGICVETSGGATVSSVTYNSIALTLVRADAGSGMRSEVWRLIAPATGANNIVVTLSVSGRVSVGAVSFTGVHQTTPIPASNAATGTSTAPSVALATTVANSWILSNCASLGTTQSSAPGANETERWDQAGAGSPPGNRANTAGDTEVTTSTGSRTMSNTLTTSAAWAIAAVEIQTAVAVASSNPQKNFIAGTIRKLVTAGIIQKEID